MSLMIVDMFCGFAGPMWQNWEKQAKIIFSNFVGEREKHKETKKEVQKKYRPTRIFFY
jgi:hypothetical protein